MKIPILNGIYTDRNGDFRVSYPRNLFPVPNVSGISEGYLRPAYGIQHFADVGGMDRGGINWLDEMYRVCGSKLVKISKTGAVTVLGDVGGSDPVVMDYSFDRLAINSDKKLFYWDGATLTQVTDVDLRDVYDFVFVDGYFMTTDGEFLVVTELNDPMSVNPLKYGSSEVDPDPIMRVLKLRGEIHAINRYTSETFQNVGGSFFPFQVIRGAQSQKGCVGHRAACALDDSIILVGSGRNESIGVHAITSGGSMKISTTDIDKLLNSYSEAQLSSTVVEYMENNGHQFVYIHLPKQTLVFDAAASQALGFPAWFVLTSGIGDGSTYRARYPVRCYGKWIVGDPLSSRVGTLEEGISDHWGQPVSWEFGTQIIYNESNGAIFHRLELVGLLGRCAVRENPMVYTDFSSDGITWSQRFPAPTGTVGQRNARLVWLQQGMMQHWRIQRFSGTSDAHLSVARLEAQMEPLYV